MCERLYDGNPLARADVSAQSHHLAALYDAGRYDAVIEGYGHLLAPTDRDALLMALACFNTQDRAQATSVLIEHLESHPYDREFLNDALQLTDTYGLDQSQSAHFHAAVDRAKSSVS